MRGIFSSFLICFSTYSVIPMPNLSWQKGSMKYIFIFLPFVGVFIGISEVLWYKAAVIWGISPFLYAATACLLPAVLSGGIHADGFIDTCDAFFSRACQDKKAEILKDPHVGAFGVLGAVAYFILFFGLLGEFFVRGGSLLLLFFTFVISRIFGAGVSVNFQPVRKSGLLYAFSGTAGKRSVTFVLFIFTLVCLALVFLFLPFYISIFFTVFSGFFLLWFYFFCKNSFGGISGDLAGFSISLYELASLGFAAFAWSFK